MYERIKILIVSVEPLGGGGSSVHSPCSFRTAKEVNRTDRKAKTSLSWKALF